MSEIRNELDAKLGEGAFANLLSSHFIPHGAHAPIWQDNFDTFLVERQAALWNQIKESTGINEASDLVEEEAG